MSVIVSKTNPASQLSKHNKRRNLLVILSVVFIDNIGSSVVYPIFSTLILSNQIPLLHGGGMISDKLSIISLLIATFPLGMIIGNFTLGALSDRIGRKKAFNFTLIGEMLGFAITALALIYKQLAWIFIGRILTGLAAGNLTLCLAGVADLSKNIKQRTLFFSLIGVSAAFAIIVGITCGGFLSSRVLGFSPSIPFWICMLLACVNWIIVIFALKETAPCHATAFSLEPVKKAIRCFIAFFFLILGWSGIIQYMSADLYSRFEQSHLAITFTLIFCGVLFMFGNLIAGKWIFEKQNRHYHLPLFFFIGSVGTFFAGFTESFMIFSCALTIAILCAAISWLGITRMISFSALDCNQGKIFGTEQSILAIAMTLSPICAGLISQKGLHCIYYFTTATLLLAFLVCPKKN